MVEIEESQGERGAPDAAADAAALGASQLPAGLSGAWPVPRTPCLGTRTGLMAELELLAYRGATGTLARLPRGAQRAFVEGMARLARRFEKRHTIAARAYLRQAFGATIDERELEERVLQAWRHLFGVTIANAAHPLHVPLASIREHYDVRMTDDVRTVLARPKGCVLVTCHVGNWESGAAILPWLGFDPLYAIAKPPRNRPFSVFAQRQREARGMRVLPRRGAMQHAAAIVEAGGTLVMLLDQRARTKPVFAPLFGRLARCDRSAGVLLRRLACPIVFAASYLTSRPYHYEVVFPAVLWPEDVAGQSPEEIARRVNVEIEGMVRAHPEQFLWLHDRYRGAPDA
jgi:KDO2-lipid IV(A) lauroyltransferase